MDLHKEEGEEEDLYYSNSGEICLVRLIFEVQLALPSFLYVVQLCDG